MIKIKRDLSILGVIAAVFLVIGAFFDLQISQAVYNPASLFGWFFNVFGELPAMIIAAFCSMSIALVSKNKGSTVRSVVFIVLSILCAMSGGMMLSDRIESLVKPWNTVVLVVTAIVIVVAVYFLAKPAAVNNGEALYKAAVLGMWLFVISLLVINLVKTAWGRERYRHMMEIGSTAGFSAWFIPQGLAGGNEFMSFPSGHSANAAVTLWFALLPTFVPALKDKDGLLKALAGVWIGLVTTSRIVMGAHFLSDVTMGMAISIIIFCLLYNHYYKKA